MENKVYTGSGEDGVYFFLVFLMIGDSYNGKFCELKTKPYLFYATY